MLHAPGWRPWRRAAAKLDDRVRPAGTHGAYFAPWIPFNGIVLAQSVNGILKVELVHRTAYPIRDKVWHDVARWIVGLRAGDDQAITDKPVVQCLVIVVRACPRRSGGRSFQDVNSPSTSWAVAVMLNFLTRSSKTGDPVAVMDTVPPAGEAVVGPVAGAGDRRMFTPSTGRTILACSMKYSMSDTSASGRGRGGGAVPLSSRTPSRLLSQRDEPALQVTCMRLGEIGVFARHDDRQVPEVLPACSFGAGMLRLALPTSSPSPI